VPLWWSHKAARPRRLTMCATSCAAYCLTMLCRDGWRPYPSSLLAVQASPTGPRFGGSSTTATET